jgi:hypothetical protein
MKKEQNISNEIKGMGKSKWSNYGLLSLLDKVSFRSYSRDLVDIYTWSSTFLSVGCPGTVAPPHFN